ncbi:MAG: hypothetical protein ACRDUY_08450 [Nitriliruptorales bacterium]
MNDSENAAGATGRSEEGTVGDDIVLIQRMLELTPEQRLLGLVQAAAFFDGARRV